MPETAAPKPIKFSATIFKIGINPLVDVPARSMNSLFKQAGRTKGPIPVFGTLNGKEFIQHVVRYQGEWRLYLNGVMRRSAKIDVGDKATVEFTYDGRPRIEPLHPKFEQALSKNKKARSVYDHLRPSRQKDINRYLNNLKSDAARERNIERVIAHLTGKKTDALYALMGR